MSREIDLMRFETQNKPRPHVNALVRPHHVFTAEHRLEAYRAGRVEGIPGDEVFRRAISELS